MISEERRWLRILQRGVGCRPWRARQRRSGRPGAGRGAGRGGRRSAPSKPVGERRLLNAALCREGRTRVFGPVGGFIRRRGVDRRVMSTLANGSAARPASVRGNLRAWAGRFSGNRWLSRVVVSTVAVVQQPVEDRFAPERDRQMRLPDSRRTEHQQRIAVRHRRRRRQLPHLAPVDAGLGLDVEVDELARHREVRHLERHLDAALVFAGYFPGDEHRQRFTQRQLLLRRLVEQVVELVADLRQLQPRQAGARNPSLNCTSRVATWGATSSG